MPSTPSTSPESPTPPATRTSPLHDHHLALGAKTGQFAGWEMPLQYAGGGVVAEHTTVRTSAGIFDVSHLGKVVVSGPGAAEYVNTTLSNDLAKIRPGKAQYTLCCDGATGGIVDDMIIYLRGPDEVFLVPNAANIITVLQRLRADAPAGVQVTDRHQHYATIAVQGPRSAEALRDVELPADHGFFSFVDAEWRGYTVLVCRSGYTGELGYELMVPYAAAGDLWEASLRAVQRCGGQPCGLGARDTLRTEAGLPLHGQDLSPEVTPVQARLSWAVGWDKPGFWGRQALLRERDQGPHRRLWGIEAGGRVIPRPHMRVDDTSGEPVGEVTSGTYSPTKQVGIGLALLAHPFGEGDVVSVDIRGRGASMAVVKPPFVRAGSG